MLKDFVKYNVFKNMIYLNILILIYKFKIFIIKYNNLHHINYY